MKPAHRRVHVVLWFVVLPGVVAMIGLAALLRSDPPPPGPSVETPSPPEGTP